MGSESLASDEFHRVNASIERARSIAWMFVHVAIPEGKIDDQLISAINRDILEAVAEAEADRWKHLEARVWVHTREIKDGTWGAAGRPFTLENICRLCGARVREARCRPVGGKKR
ncbi:MAG TPA: hypothetical protein VGM75_13770, partial [Pseudonocardiaceae bacterium]